MLQDNQSTDKNQEILSEINPEQITNNKAQFDKTNYTNLKAKVSKNTEIPQWKDSTKKATKIIVTTTKLLKITSEEAHSYQPFNPITQKLTVP